MAGRHRGTRQQNERAPATPIPHHLPLDRAALSASPDAPVAISLFSGAGGLSLGFRAAGFRVACASDIEKSATKTYAAMLPGTQVETADVRTLSATKLRKAAGGKVDIIVGGPPCQGFTSARGAKWWDDPRNALLRAYVRLLGELRPTWFVMENVEGLLTAHDSHYVTEFIEHVVELGYWVRLNKLNLAHFGVPQRRKRVFVVGNLCEQAYEPPTATHGAESDLLSQLRPMVTLWDAISDLPDAATKDEEVWFTDPPSNDLQLLLRSGAEKVVHHFRSELPERTLQRMQALKPGQDMRHLPADLQHESYHRRAFRRVMDGTATEHRGGAPAGLQRLESNLPSKTITSAAIREFIHPYRDRHLTIRECARIQTFPDWYEFSGTPGQKIQQIGNAVPPLAAFFIAKQIRRYMTDGASRSRRTKGHLLGFSLSGSDGRSPALRRTEELLAAMQANVRDGRRG